MKKKIARKTMEEEEEAKHFQNLFDLCDHILDNPSDHFNEP